jgi:hypothetical protein
MDASNCVIDRMTVASRGMLPLRYVGPPRSLLNTALGTFAYRTGAATTRGRLVSFEIADQLIEA